MYDTPTPNVPVIREWTKALRSGNYPQAQSALRTPHGYCCLGVLCELAVKRGIIPPGEEVYDFQEPRHRYGHPNDTSTTELPNTVATWAGLDPDPYAIPHDAEPQSLAEINDSDYSFPEIADIIDRNFT